MINIFKNIGEMLNSILGWTRTEKVTVQIPVEEQASAPAAAQSTAPVANPQGAVTAAPAADPQGAAPAAPVAPDADPQGTAPDAPAAAPQGTAPATHTVEQEKVIKAISRRDTKDKASVLIVSECVKPENKGGVADSIRALDLAPDNYENLVQFFHSNAVDLQALWSGLQNTVVNNAPLARLPSQESLPAGQSDLVLATDHKLHAYEGSRTGGVKKLHQASENINKSQTINGLKYGAVGILLGNDEKGYVCAPACMDIEYGFNGTIGWASSTVKKESANTRGVRQALLVCDQTERNGLVVCDSAYFTNEIMDMAIERNKTAQYQGHVLTRAEKGTSAYELPPTTRAPGKMGAPLKKGKKIKIVDLFSEIDKFESSRVVIYGKEQTVRYMSKELLWGKKLHKLRFIFAIMEDGRRTILVTTNFALTAIDCIVAYAMRYKEEKMFREFSQVFNGFGAMFSCEYAPKPDKYSKAGDPDPLAKITDEKQQEKIMANKKAHETYAFVNSAAMAINQILSFELDIDLQTIRWQRTYRTNRPTELLMREYLRGAFIAGLLSDNDDPLLQLIREAQQYKSGGLHNPEAVNKGREAANAARVIRRAEEAEAAKAAKAARIEAAKAAKAAEAAKAAKAAV